MCSWNVVQEEHCGSKDNKKIEKIKGIYMIVPLSRDQALGAFSALLMIWNPDDQNSFGEKITVHSIGVASIVKSSCVI